MPDEPTDELALLRQENERLKNAKAPWFDRHFAVLATAMVSLATLSFSAVQWRVAQLNERSAQAERLRMETQEEQRRNEEWAFKGLEFIFSHERYFFGDNPRDFQKAVRILAVGFPGRVSEPLLKRLEMTASPEQKMELKIVHAQMNGETPPPRPPGPPPAPSRPVPERTPRPVVDQVRDRTILDNRPLPERRPDPIVERPRPIEDRRPDRRTWR